jgi:hypothetical protein
MSKLMIILGIIAAAAGAAVGALIYVSPGQMQVLGLTPEVAAISLLGGLGLIGLGGVIGALHGLTATFGDWLAGQENGKLAPESSPSVVSDFTTSTVAPPPFPVPPAPAEPPPASKLDALLRESRAETSRAAAESKQTKNALDQARDRLEEVLRPAEPEQPSRAQTPAQSAEAVQSEEPAVTVDEAEDTQLFVVEERLIRGRPARVLSDGTVEAETDDGWMRFENLEHLEEYLDAMAPGQA